MGPGAKLAVATAAGKNYVPFARVLAESLAAQHAGIPFFFALADEVDGCFDPTREPYELLPIAELPIPDLGTFLAQYDRREAAIAVKPYVLQSVLDRGFRAVVYIDVDILVLGKLTGLFEATEAHASTLVPHLLEPLEGPDRADRELNILQSGVFNGGVLGLRESGEARRLTTRTDRRSSRATRIDSKCPTWVRLSCSSPAIAERCSMPVGTTHEPGLTRTVDHAKSCRKDLWRTETRAAEP